MKKIIDLKDWLLSQENKELGNSVSDPITVQIAESETSTKGIADAIGKAKKYVNLDLSHTKITNIGAFDFLDCIGLVSIALPDSVTEIGVAAFWQCANLSSITIPDGVTKIEPFAFWDCTSLANVTIPNSVTEIRGYAFWYCTSLASVTIGNGVTYIGTAAFKGCTSLTSVEFKGHISSEGFISDAFIGNLRYCFYHDDKDGYIGTFTTTAPVNKDSKWS